MPRLAQPDQGDPRGQHRSRAHILTTGGAAAGLHPLPGVVLTTAFAAEIDAGAHLPRHAAVAEAFAATGRRRTHRSSG